MFVEKHKKSIALALASALLLCAAAPAWAAEPLDGDIHASVDEAYYGTTDYYGNLTEGSIVKSYVVNGQTSIRDYGQYDSVSNLTDGTAPTQEDGALVFSFEDEDKPSHFYFEGKTDKPFEELPWTISLHYELNGVPVKAEELAGKTGLVEIFFDAIPNENASDYAKCNYTLEAMALFNQDDILSLEAPGAQVQLLGNLRTALFIVLPGEEQHFSIKVGSDSFTFGGMTFLMVPATLSQLEEVAKLSQKKDTLEDNYRKLSGSMDQLLNALSSLTSSLNASANGLDSLNTARETFSSGKDSIYAGIDAVKSDAAVISAQLAPVAERITGLKVLAADTQDVFNRMADSCTQLQDTLSDLENDLTKLQQISDVQLRNTIKSLASMSDELDDLKDSLEKLSSKKLAGTISSVMTSSSDMKTVIAVHNAYELKSEDSFVSAMIKISGSGASLADLKTAAQTAAAWAQYAQSTDPQVLAAFAMSQGASPEQVSAVLTGAGTYKALTSLYEEKDDMNFTQFCEAVLDLRGESNAKEQAKTMNKAWNEYKALDSYGNGSTSDTVDAIADDLSEQGFELDAAAQASINSLLRSISKTTLNTAALLEDLSELCDDIGRIEKAGLTDTLIDTAENGKELSQDARELLDQIKSVNSLLNDYQPTLQEALTNAGEISTTAVTLMNDVLVLTDNTEALLKESGTQLDEGTRDTLTSLSQTLRKAANATASTGDIRKAKDTITGLIEDTWEDYTGGINNMLLIDAQAPVQSLTDSRNPSPSSVQVLIRTQEIKAPKAQTEDIRTAAAAGTTLAGRIAQMFKDLWSSITGIFRK